MQIFFVRFPLSTGGYPFNTLVWGEPETLDSGPRNLSTKNRGILLSYGVPRNLSTKNRGILLSYGVDILTENYLVLSQSTRLTDRQMSIARAPPNRVGWAVMD